MVVGNMLEEIKAGHHAPLGRNAFVALIFENAESQENIVTMTSYGDALNRPYEVLSHWSVCDAVTARLLVLAQSCVCYQRAIEEDQPTLRPIKYLRRTNKEH